ncbi:hypothetical protein CCHR01_03390 [Colletotrichum chrysophilum]|uniref:Fungal N-terminal domain-containing protein n=1 Tax=Colletotrichum chrysophilum TaxID=1836956 RepID=A0AAD9AVC6_9PEZI|nr:hypothetical protein CCHR01_03390 [Colletotrichum chrysophilum]
MVSFSDILTDSELSRVVFISNASSVFITSEMDPISIAATAASLAGAAGSTAIVLIRLAKKVKNVDIKLSETCAEVQKLSGLLVSVDKTIGDTLVDCKSNIAGLDQLLRKLSVHFDAEGNSLATLLRKTNFYFILSIHKEEIQDYKVKIFNSNWAIQMTLQLVTIALSFRTNISQERLFQELNKLEGMIKKSLRKAHQELPGPETEQKMEIAARNVPYIYFDMFDEEIDERKHPYETTDQHGGVQASGRPDQDETPSSRIAEDNCGNMDQALSFSQTSLGPLGLPPRPESPKKHAASRFFDDELEETDMATGRVGFDRGRRMSAMIPSTHLQAHENSIGRLRSHSQGSRPYPNTTCHDSVAYWHRSVEKAELRDETAKEATMGSFGPDLSPLIIRSDYNLAPDSRARQDQTRQKKTQRLPSLAITPNQPPRSVSSYSDDATSSARKGSFLIPTLTRATSDSLHPSSRPVERVFSASTPVTPVSCTPHRLVKVKSFTDLPSRAQSQKMDGVERNRKHW